MRNAEVHNSKPASPQLRDALIPGEVRSEVMLTLGSLVSLRANQLEQQKRAKVSDGIVHAIPNTDHPRYHEMVKEGRFLPPASFPTEPFLSDDFVIPPSTRIVEVKGKSAKEKPAEWVSTSDERKKHIAAVKEVLKNGTRQRGGIEQTLNAKQIERREIDLHRLESVEKYGRGHNSR